MSCALFSTVPINCHFKCHKGLSKPLWSWPQITHAMFYWFNAIAIVSFRLQKSCMEHVTFWLVYKNHAKHLLMSNSLLSLIFWLKSTLILKRFAKLSSFAHKFLELWNFKDKCQFLCSNSTPILFFKIIFRFAFLFEKCFVISYWTLSQTVLWMCWVWKSAIHQILH